MVSEYRYFTITSLLGISGLVGLSNLLQKYGTITLGHWADTCQLLFSNFFSSGTHLAGMVLIALVVLVAGAGLIRVILSLIKTNQKVNNLIKFKTSNVPTKLKVIATNHHLDNDRLVVIDYSERLAFSFGLFKPRMVISKGMVDLLTTKQLEAVVLHELYHLRYRHGILLFMSDILAAMVFFFPIVKSLVYKMSSLCERQADDFVIRSQSYSGYLKLALAKTMPYRRQTIYPGFAVVEVRERLNHLLRKETSNNNIPIGALFFSSLVLLLGIGLWLLPIKNHALAVNMATTNNCGGNQCSMHCLTDTQIVKENNVYFTSAIYTPLTVENSY